MQNRRIVLASRPQVAASEVNFRLETTAAAPEPGDGQVLLRTVWLSLDPYMRGRMSNAPSCTGRDRRGHDRRGEASGSVGCSRPSGQTNTGEDRPLAGFHSSHPHFLMLLQLSWARQFRLPGEGHGASHYGKVKDRHTLTFP